MESVCIPQRDRTAFQLHQTVLREAFEHPRYRLPRRADVLSDLRASPDRIRAGTRRFRKEKFLPPPIQAPLNKICCIAHITSENRFCRQFIEVNNGDGGFVPQARRRYFVGITSTSVSAPALSCKSKGDLADDTGGGKAQSSPG